MFLIASVFAASLDNLEIAGPWGHPLATDGAAAWWNPAGIPMGTGTRILIEGAPTFATILYERAEPHGGEDPIKLTGVVPYAGIATDLGVPGLGLGFGFALPFVRGGEEVNPPGSGSYTLREGHVQGAYIMAGGGWRFADRVAVGAMGGLLLSGWTAVLDNDTMPLLNEQIQAMGQDPGYTDADLENPDYAATLTFGQLSDRIPVFSAGLQAAIHPKVRLGAAYIHGGNVQNTGDVEIVFGCPPQSDTTGRFGAESFGICDTTLKADAAISYGLPNRFHGGIQILPIEPLAITVFGGWVHWSVFKDYTIKISGIEDKNDLPKEETADLVNQERLWARDNHDSLWGAIDAKYNIGMMTFGAWILYDQAAVPDEAVSTNNWDADTVMLTGLLAITPFRIAAERPKYVTVGFSYSHYFIATRTIKNSAFGMTIEEEPKEDRFFYPHANGTYSGAVDRLGIQLQAAF